MNKLAKLPLILIAVSLFLALFIINTAQDGLRFTPDSHAYVDLARHWYQSYVLDKHHTWPPLYAAVLSLAKEEVSIKYWAQVLNALSMSGAIWVWTVLMAKYIRRKPLLWVYALALASCMEMHWMAQFLWSESFFVLLITLYAYAVYQYLEAKSRQGFWLFGLLILASLLPLQRHAGLFLLCGSVVAGFLFTLKDRRITLFHLHGLLAFIPWLLWAYRAHWLQDLDSFYEDHYGEMSALMQFVLRIAETANAFGEVMLRAFMPSMLLPDRIEAILGFFSLLIVWGFIWPWHFKKPFPRWIAFMIWAYMIMFLYVGYSYRIDMLRFYGAIWPVFLGLSICRVDDRASQEKNQPFLNKFPAYFAYLPYLWLAYTGARLGYHLVKWASFPF